ncbi:MAG: ankyrin repeat domain-containing protein [Pseudomonadota bacterium]
MTRKPFFLAAFILAAACLLAGPSWAAPGNPRTQSLAQALYDALSRADVGLLAEVSNKGADLNVTIRDAGLAPLKTFGPQVDDLLRTNMDVNNWTPLMWTAFLTSTGKVEYYDFARVLIKNGAELNSRDSSGTTALHWAAWAGNYPMVILLLQNGANAEVTDYAGRTPLDWALNSKQTDVIRALSQEASHRAAYELEASRGVGDADGDGVPDDMDACPNSPPGVKVDENGCWVAMFRDFFDTDKSTVKKSALPQLKQAAEVLLANPRLTVEIAGHADSRGSEQYNLDLGRRRAEAVRAILIKYGVSPSRLAYKSFGETQPAADNKTKEGMAQNRRVEIHFWEARK